MKTQINEIWKNVDGYNGKYQVSNFGRVRNTDYRGTGEERLVSIQEQKYTGYQYANLTYGKTTRTYLVHRLVALAFIDNPSNLEQIDHINNNRTDNRVSNLRWVSRKTNNGRKHARLQRSLNSKPGEHRAITLTKDNITVQFRTQQEAADYIGCSRVLITKALQDTECHHALGWTVQYSTQSKSIYSAFRMQKLLPKLKARLAKWENHKPTNKSEIRIQEIKDAISTIEESVVDNLYKSLN